jgi:hypothetical protein
MVMGLKGKAYGNVEVASFFDAAGLREALPTKIREVAAKAPLDTASATHRLANSSSLRARAALTT